MRLWTIQPIEVYQELMNKGVFSCNPNKSKYLSDIDFIQMRESYDWLVTQMDKRGIVHPEGINYPIWAWHTRDWKYKKPDLRNSGFDTKGKKCVCIEFEIPDEKVLLSDFDEWHNVLNRMPIDSSSNEKEFDEFYAWYDTISQFEKEKYMIESWNQIFDLTPINTKWRSKGKWIQATFWQLRLEDVKDVRFFTCR